MLNTAEKKPSTLQLRELKNFGNRVNEIGCNFAAFDNCGELILLCEGGKFKSDKKSMKRYCNSIIESIADDIESFGSLRIEGRYLGVVLNSASTDKNQGEITGIVLIDVGTDSTRQGKESTKEKVSVVHRAMGSMLELFAENFHTKRSSSKQIEKVGTELAQVYEELVLLHKISTNMKLTESDSNYLQMACDSLTDIVDVEGIAIFLEKFPDGERQLVLAAGSGLIDVNQRMANILHSRLEEEINSGKETLLDSEIDSPFRYEWDKNVRNIIAVPLFGKDKISAGISEGSITTHHMIGFMVAVNRIGRPDFDSIDAKLFDSVANGCAVFIENDRLFKDLKELFIGSLKALTSSIDAKDQYTRGHSERVAFISRWIAEKVAGEEPLREEQIHRVYLAGLLHDIGKMGVNEAVLQKEGRLTNEEFDCMKKHPSIGGGILSEIKQMRDIIPGVLCHHERVDGKGYPDGLVGNQIPLIGKIVGLADSFDAMTSKRTYRDAMTIEQALAEIERGLGTQFDKKVGKIFIDSDVYRLWDILQGGLNGTYGSDGSVKYGTVAVGTLIR